MSSIDNDLYKNEYQITDAHTTEYNDQGVIVLRDVISAPWLALLAQAVERDITEPGPFYHGYEPKDGKGKFHGNLRIWENDPVFKDYCLHSVLPSIAAQLMKSERVNLLYDQLFIKEANTMNPTRWHSDQPYWPIQGKQIVSFWLCLDTVDQKNGALEFVRGSHLWDRWFQPESFGEGSGAEYEINEDFETMLDIENNRDSYDIASWNLKPGDLYVFQGMTVHGAKGNSTTDQRRRGYTVRYVGDDIRYDIRKGLSTPICNSEMIQGDKLSGVQYPQVYPF
ncbi:MAG: ectoine hydroxylase-related dioxygenase (phytanoyl-CoA dioxygenase family) [Oceanospirillaceae bacterium]|jgi:ectoine hydroxylase-related dioxygenase (phytanoyl-CoA dioxygenase family)